YADGIIVIPLSGGCLQAVSAATLETLWVVEGVSGAQSLSTLTVSDGYVYVSTADSLNDSWNASSGTIRRINLRTGALAGSASNDESGYYWAGGVMANGWFLVPDDSGKITSYAADLSTMIGSVQVGDKGIRSSLVVEGGFVYAASSDGVLHKLSVGEDGASSRLRGPCGSLHLHAHDSGRRARAAACRLQGRAGGDRFGHDDRDAGDEGGRGRRARRDQAPRSCRCKAAERTCTSRKRGDGFAVRRLRRRRVRLPGGRRAGFLLRSDGRPANYCMASVIAGPDGTCTTSDLAPVRPQSENGRRPMAARTTAWLGRRRQRRCRQQGGAGRQAAWAAPLCSRCYKPLRKRRRRRAMPGRFGAGRRPGLRLAVADAGAGAPGGVGERGGRCCLGRTRRREPVGCGYRCRHRRAGGRRGVRRARAPREEAS
ncbi:MAG: PQQ-binding-like beta-propeller repeat protein, partial [Eggerthellaceae bacterium]